jgi:hypothetical protein
VQEPFFSKKLNPTFSLTTQAMYNAEKRGKRQVLVRPVSKVVIKFLQVMQKHGERIPGARRAIRSIPLLFFCLPSRLLCF